MFENKLDFFSRKTVVILDRSAKFLAPSKQHIDFDSGGKRGSGKKASSALVYKSLWTCCVEGAVEYSRIVYDLFPCRYMVSMSGVKWRGLLLLRLLIIITSSTKSIYLNILLH